MISSNKIRTSDMLTVLYASAVITFAVFSLASVESGLFVLRFLMIPTLFSVYAFSVSLMLRNFVFGLLALYISNILLNWETELNVFLSLIFYTIFRIFVVIIIFKNIKKIRALAWLLASIPFLCGFLYLISLTEEALGPNIYTAVFNAVFISLLVGIALSHYIFEESIENSWLLIAMLFLALNNFIFVLDRYYFQNQFFQPVRIILSGVGLFGLMRYVVLTQNLNRDGSANNI